MNNQTNNPYDILDPDFKKESSDLLEKPKIDKKHNDLKMAPTTVEELWNQIHYKNGDTVCTFETLNSKAEIAYHITSYGIIAFTKIGKKYKFLLGKPRYSPEYCTMVRGKCSKHNIKYFLSQMSEFERSLLKKYSLVDLWFDIFPNSDKKIKRGQMLYYEEMKPIIDKYLQENNFEKFEREGPEWGFFKGRMEKNESKKITAIREFQEETGLNFNGIGGTILDIPAIVENYIGTDNKHYRTIYYIAKIDNIFEPIPKKINGTIVESLVSVEIAEVKWFDYEHALLILNERRMNMICKVKYMLDLHYKKINYT